MLHWEYNLEPREWDNLLSQLGGHPLQSALWGNARAEIDGIKDHRWAGYKDGSPVWLSRIEERPLPLSLGKAAWIPKGPVIHADASHKSIHNEFKSHLKKKGYWLLVENRYAPLISTNGEGGVALSDPYKTIWIDLTLGEEAILKRMHKKWRYGVRASERAGVTVEQTTNKEDVAYFFSLCQQVSEDKGFSLPGSEPLLQHLLANRGIDDQITAQLFVARVEGVIAAGAFTFKCGHSLHYLWGATDRSYSKQCVGEAVQWGVIKWGFEKGVQRYDLEGINPESNPGVYKFKSRMGGEEVALYGQRGFSLNALGKVALALKAK